MELKCEMTSKPEVNLIFFKILLHLPTDTFSLSVYKT